MSNDVSAQVEVLRDLCKMQQVQIAGLESSIIDLWIDLANSDFQIGGL